MVSLVWQGVVFEYVVSSFAKNDGDEISQWTRAQNSVRRMNYNSTLIVFVIPQNLSVYDKLMVKMSWSKCSLNEVEECGRRHKNSLRTEEA